MTILVWVLAGLGLIFHIVGTVAVALTEEEETGQQTNRHAIYLTLAAIFLKVMQ